MATAEHDDLTADGGIDPDDLEVCLRVLAQANELPLEHPHALAIQRATARVYKTVKHRRRVAKRQAVQAHDEAVTAATATGAPGRIDDETRGIPLRSSVPGVVVGAGSAPDAVLTAGGDATADDAAARLPDDVPRARDTGRPLAGVLIEPRACYVCKTRYTEVDAFYHQLCPPCADLHHQRRDQRTDLTGRRALLTGGRAKIGMYIALRLLRDGAHTTITTRFPNDAARRFSQMPDAHEWLHRLEIVGIDLRDPAQVIALAEDVAARGPLDVLINNAAQTVRRSPQAYAPLLAAERAALPDGPLPPITTYGDHATRPTSAAGGGAPGQLTGGGEASDAAAGDLAAPNGAYWAPTPHALAALALQAGSASPARIAANMAIDAGGLIPDLHAVNSWSQVVHEVDPIELLEVQLCNQTAPFLLVSRLRPALAASPARRTYVVNVSAMEGQFSRGYKGPGHPHTNMAKAALNMLTRTSAQEMLERDGILMTAVDTGWITDERPHPQKMRLADAGFHAPLDLVDGAARVYDPIVRGEAGEDLHGVFLKDYRPSPW
jgi:NAD(P)-dependent dehydrogenase (short-subunit alcohol dehydrogenase family)